MASSGLGEFFANLKALPHNLRRTLLRHGAPTSDRARSQAVFSNVFLHVHPTRVHPHSLRLTTTFGLGIALISLFLVLACTGTLLMVYYNPGIEHAYDSIKDLHHVVPAGRFIRNIHRWAAHLMVVCVILHVARVFYTSAYKSPREFNWVVGVGLLVLTLGLSFTGYLLPWDQLAFWAITIGSNIAAAPNELVDALGLPAALRIGDLQRELLLGSSTVGQDALIRFYLLHVIVLPVLLVGMIAVHIWRIRKDGGLARPGGTPRPSGKGVGNMAPEPQAPADAPDKSFGLMCVVKDRSPETGKDLDETAPAWPYLLRAELLVFMATMLLCVVLGYFFDAPLSMEANPAIPENPAKAPWYFLGLQELVSYSAFVGGVVLPGLAVVGLGLVPYLDREEEAAGVWFSGGRGRRTALWSALVGAVAAVLAVAIPVRFGWLRTWFPDIKQIWILLINPGSLLTGVYILWSLAVMHRTRSTRLGAIALMTCLLLGFAILTYVGMNLRGPNWDFYWSKSLWPVH